MGNFPDDDDPWNRLRIPAAAQLFPIDQGSIPGPYGLMEDGQNLLFWVSHKPSGFRSFRDCGSNSEAIHWESETLTVVSLLDILGGVITCGLGKKSRGAGRRFRRIRVCTHRNGKINETVCHAARLPFAETNFKTTNCDFSVRSPGRPDVVELS